jgi:hypothetical protein
MKSKVRKRKLSDIETMPEPIRIEPNGIYTRDTLKAILDPVGIDVDFFIRRLKPKKVFRLAWFGVHLIEAWEQAPALYETKPTPNGMNRGNRRGKGSSKGSIFSDADLGIETD